MTGKDLKILPELGEVEFDFSPELTSSTLPIVKETLTNVRLIKLSAREDDRGILLKDIKNFELAKDKDGKPMFGEHYNVINPEPMIRGFHAHRELWDYFCIVMGRSKVVLFDARRKIGGKANPSYGKGNEFFLSDRNPNVLVIPPGVFHGSKSFVPNTLLSVIGTHLYDSGNPDEFRVPHTSFGYDWEIQIK